MDRSVEFKKIINEKQSLYQIPHEPRVKSGKQSLFLTKKSKVNKKEWVALQDGLRELVKKITILRNFLITNRRDYLNLYSPLTRESSSMTDMDRERIEFYVHDHTTKYHSLLAKYKNELSLKANSGTRQIHEHFTLVFSLVEAYLKSVCNIFNEQRALRIKRACERQRLSKLASAFKDSLSLTPLSFAETNSGIVDSNISSARRSSVGNSGMRENVGTTRAYSEEDSTPVGAEDEQMNLSARERQLLKQENDELYERFQNDEFKSIQGSVIEITRLHDFFVEKVLEQNEDMSRVGTTLVSSTENIYEGNDELREALKKRAGNRVWVLFILITLSFTVLFLDWYNA